MLIFVIGVRGAGKTSCLDGVARVADVVVLQPSTTRPKRDPSESEYDFRAAFDVPMAWEIDVGAYKYGMRQSQIDAVTSGAMALTVFDPGNIGELLRFRATARQEVVIVGLDTIATVADQAARVGSGPRMQTQASIDDQRAILHAHADLLLSGDLDQNIAAIVATTKVLRRGGIFDGETIRRLAKGGTLLRGHDDRLIQTASYDLRLAPRLKLERDVLVQLTDNQPHFNIPPYSFVIVEAMEKVDLPRFAAGRFDVRVSLFMKGVLLSNGPQVDPGFQGSLFCALYNSSDEPVAIKRGDHFATIEFHTTAVTAIGPRTSYQGFEGIEALSADILASAGSKLLDRISNATADVQRAWGKWSVGMTIGAALLALPAAWGLSSLIESIKLSGEAKAKLDESQKITADLTSKAAEADKLIRQLKEAVDGKKASIAADKTQAVKP